MQSIYDTCIRQSVSEAVFAVFACDKQQVIYPISRVWHCSNAVEVDGEAERETD